MKISRIKCYKFNIICNNDTEWCAIQEELFKLGYRWQSVGKEIRFSTWKYPLVIKNYRSDDMIGNKFLIEDSYNFLIKSEKNLEFINAISYFRKKKLKKINGIKSKI